MNGDQYIARAEPFFNLDALLGRQCEQRVKRATAAGEPANNASSHCSTECGDERARHDKRTNSRNSQRGKSSQPSQDPSDETTGLSTADRVFLHRDVSR